VRGRHPCDSDLRERAAPASLSAALAGRWIVSSESRTPSFRAVGPCLGTPFPPPGPRGSGSPFSSVLRRALTPRAPSRRASFPSVGGTTVAPVDNAGSAGAPHLRGFWFRSASGFFRGEHEVSQVPGESSCVRALFSDPGEAGTPGHAAARCDLPGLRLRRPSREILFSGLNRTARTLAVYASQPGSPPHHARLASGW
jgi:hypothetical protein